MSSAYETTTSGDLYFSVACCGSSYMGFFFLPITVCVTCFSIQKSAFCNQLCLPEMQDLHMGHILLCASVGEYC
jgi:hypothetical protein